jgi:hypothetical protein
MTVLALVAPRPSNRLGQRAAEHTERAPVATMTLSGPTAVRVGLFFQARVDLRAAPTIEHPRLVWTPVGSRACR